LRAEIVTHEVQLQAMQAYETEGNPQVQLLKKELQALQGQLAQVETETNAGSGMTASAGRFTTASLEYIRKLRDMKYHETLFEMLSRQYEAARIEEAREGPLLQVVDRAVVPDRKSWPPRTLLTIGGGVLGLLGASILTLLRQAFRTLSLTPDHAGQLKGLSDALHSWSGK
jgi:tyrosine-protein kinase Etk/Wzc